MQKVETDYAASGMTDSEFAKNMSTPDVQYTVAMIREWRKQLDIPNNVPTKEDPQVNALKALLEEALIWLEEPQDFSPSGHECSAHTDMVTRIKEALK